MSELIKNWKFSLIFIIFTILCILLPIQNFLRGIQVWVGFLLFVCFIGIVYEIAKWIERRKKLKKRKK